MIILPNGKILYHWLRFRADGGTDYVQQLEDGTEEVTVYRRACIVDTTRP